MIALATIALVLGGLYLLFEVGCNRGVRIAGVSWFDIQHEMRGSSKKSKGRMQQRKKHR